MRSNLLTLSYRYKPDTTRQAKSEKQSADAILDTRTSLTSQAYKPGAFSSYGSQLGIRLVHSPTVRGTAPSRAGFSTGAWSFPPLLVFVRRPAAKGPHCVQPSSRFMSKRSVGGGMSTFSLAYPRTEMCHTVLFYNDGGED